MAEVTNRMPVIVNKAVMPAAVSSLQYIRAIFSPFTKNGQMEGQCHYKIITILRIPFFTG